MQRNISLEDQFMYHPPETEERKAKHAEWNNIIMQAVLWLNGNVTKAEPFSQALQQAQMLRMLGNQCITYDELAKQERENADN